MRFAPRLTLLALAAVASASTAIAQSRADSAAIRATALAIGGGS